MVNAMDSGQRFIGSVWILALVLPSPTSPPGAHGDGGGLSM